MPNVFSPYKAKGLFKNGHFATIYSAKLRPVPRVLQKRERLELSDGDFIDVDWSYSRDKSHKVAILLHGLEGNAQRVYIKGQAKVLTENGWDIAAMNHRGCSGDPPDSLTPRVLQSGLDPSGAGMESVCHGCPG